MALLCAVLVIGLAGGAVAQLSEADDKKATEKLFEAAEVGNLEGVQASISAGGNMNAVDYRGLTPADVAADRGHFNVVHFLLSVRNVRKTIDGSTPSSAPPLASPLAAATTALPSLLATPPAPAPPPGVPRSAPSLPVLSAPLSASPPPQPVGPQGQPNPFDPSTVALGSTLTVVPEPAPIPIPTSRPIPTSQPTLGAVVAEVEAPAQPILGMAMEMEAPLQPPLGAVVAETPPAPPPAPVAKAETPPPPPAPVAKAESPSPPARPFLGMSVGERQEPLSTPTPPPPDVVAMAQAAPVAEEKPAEPVPAAEKPQIAATPQSSAAAPAAEEKPEESENLFAALGRLLKAASAEDDPAASAEDKQAASAEGDPAASAEGKQAVAQESEQVATASQTSEKEPARAKPNPASPLPPVSLPPISLPDNHLTGQTLAIGASGVLGTATPTDGKGRSCVTRRSGAMTLCVESVTWPAEMEKIFSVKSLIYDGAKAIVRYDEGKATRFHVLFPTDSFDTVVAYFTRRFGPATRTGTPPIEALGPIGQKNRTAAWVNLDPATKAVSALEIRAIDDIRGSLPDTRHGVVILIPGRAAPILPRRALLQLMMRKAGA